MSEYTHAADLHWATAENKTMGGRLIRVERRIFNNDEGCQKWQPSLARLRFLSVDELGYKRIALSIMGLKNVDHVWNVLLLQRSRSVFCVCGLAFVARAKAC
jgi:hypothetical protein